MGIRIYYQKNGNISFALITILGKVKDSNIYICKEFLSSSNRYWALDSDLGELKIISDSSESAFVQLKMKNLEEKLENSEEPQIEISIHNQSYIVIEKIFNKEDINNYQIYTYISPDDSSHEPIEDYKGNKGMLNYLLDKIQISGIKSLDPFEQDLLENYSKN